MVIALCIKFFRHLKGQKNGAKMYHSIGSNMKRPVYEQIRLVGQMHDAYLEWSCAFKSNNPSQHDLKNKYIALKDKCNEYDPPDGPY
jgi:hypothetical protein